MKNFRFFNKIISILNKFTQREGVYKNLLKLCKIGVNKFSKYKEIKICFQEDMVLAYENLGELAHQKSRLEEALKYYKEALKIDREIRDRQGEGNNLTNIGNVYAELGQYEEALKYSEEALKIFRDIGYKKGEGRNLGNIGVVYAELGQYEEALKYSEEALKIGREIRDKKEERIDLTNMGAVYVDLRQYEEAYSYEKRAIELYDQIIESVSSEFTTSALTAMKDPYRNGLNYLLKAIKEKAEENSELIKELPEIIEKKKSRRLAKNFKEKIGMLNRDKLNEVIDKIREKDAEISSLIKNREKLERNKTKGNKEGLARIEERINALIKERDELFEEEKALVPGLRFESIKHLKEVLKGKNKKSLILEISVIENYKDNKEKKEAIDKTVFALLNSEDDEIKIYEKNIKEAEKREIERYKLIDELLYRKDASTTRTRDTIEKIKSGKELEELEKEIENISTGVKGIEKDRVKSTIRKKILLRKEILEELIKEYGGSEEKFIEVLGKPDIFYEEAERLKRTIIPEELFNEINMYYDRGFKYLFVSPEGEYHNVPWEAVKSEWKGNSNRKADRDIPLGIKFKLVRMFSADATSASIERESRSFDKGILTIASVFHKEKQDLDDETGTVKSIGEKALGENRVVIVAGEKIDVGKENIKDKFAESKVIHISTHGKSGTINVKYRIKSTKEKINEIEKPGEEDKGKEVAMPITHIGILLFKKDGKIDSEEDLKYTLKAENISHMDLKHNPFVFLNACETGITSKALGYGDEREGLATAFLNAGALSVVGTNWTIYTDKAKEFSERLYNYLLINNDAIMDAMHKAMRESYEETKDYSRDWAGFMITGDVWWKVV